LVFLDQIQDPHNLGAIVRSAHAVGADAIVLPRRGACGLTAAAVKAAAGAAEHVPICQVDNIQKALQKVRALGVWTIGLDAQGDTDFTSVDYGRACALVVGSEGRGLRRMVGERCDFLVSIPMARSEVGSLNASVAAGIVLYEVHRQRRS
ncbi:MAG: 23S rRNA (guanosine(2251)-2'-O)-methyltransferase RlmB, partial [Candidatus Latescibacterota bacterium]